MSAICQPFCRSIPIGAVIADRRSTITDANSLLGWNIGAYVQDEWKLTDQLTLNTGLPLRPIVSVRQCQPVQPARRAGVQAVRRHDFHAGYARYFTPPMQAQATQSNIALFTNTTNQPDVPSNDPVLPERSHYFDVGIDQTVLPGLDFGVDAYYKIAHRS